MPDNVTVNVTSCMVNIPVNARDRVTSSVTLLGSSVDNRVRENASPPRWIGCMIRCNSQFHSPVGVFAVFPDEQSAYVSSTLLIIALCPTLLPARFLARMCVCVFFIYLVNEGCMQLPNMLALTNHISTRFHFFSQTHNGVITNSVSSCQHR